MAVCDGSPARSRSIACSVRAMRMTRWSSLPSCWFELVRRVSLVRFNFQNGKRESILLHLPSLELEHYDHHRDAEEQVGYRSQDVPEGSEVGFQGLVEGTNQGEKRPESGRKREHAVADRVSPSAFLIEPPGGHSQQNEKPDLVIKGNDDCVWSAALLDEQPSPN